MSKKKLFLWIIIPLLVIVVSSIYFYQNYTQRTKQNYEKSSRAEVEKQIERTNKWILERDEQLAKLGNSLNDKEIKKSIEAEKEQVKTIRENLLKELEQIPPVKTPFLEKREYNTLWVIWLILLSYMIGIWYYLEKKPLEIIERNNNS